jgi:DNA primase
MNDDVKDQIRARLNIADVIGEVVALKPAGRERLKGLCPFHNEKTPSFQVHLDKGFYYCFGCQATGDIFKFVMETQAMTFPDALRLLGERAGVEVTSHAPKDARRDLVEVNQLALAYFRANLDHTAREYLMGRGLTQASIDDFEIGRAPSGWDGLLTHALTKGVREADLLTLGLIIENERGRRYDRFRDRIMFPIKDALGRVVGFSGRVLDDSLPKYMNSPESSLFRKSELLYGLDRARTAIRREREVIVVEGYTDVIALHQAGLSNAVAALGATVTTEQADVLERLDARTVYLAFDADEAGQKAILSGLDQAVGRRLMVKAVTVPHGKDPAEAVLGGHLDEFKAALEAGASEVEFRLSRVLERHDPSTVEGKRAILEELQGVLRPRELFDPVAAEMRRLVLERLDMDAARLDDWLTSRTQRRPSATEVHAMRGRRVELDQAKRIEAEVIALALLEPGRLKERLQVIVAALPGEVTAGDSRPAGAAAPDATTGTGGSDVGSSLRYFAAACLRHDFDQARLLDELHERDEGVIVLRRLMENDNDHEGSRLDIDLQLTRALSRLRELTLDGQKEDGRSRLLQRRDELAQMLVEASGERLTALYEELQSIQGALAARDAERRMRLPATHGRGRKRG